MRKPLNIKGDVFGELTAMEMLNKRKYGCVVWACQCSCGRHTEVNAGWLVNGLKKSCGCKSDELKYGLRRSKTTCERGHPYELGSFKLYKEQRGHGFYRRCYICHNELRRARYAQKKKLKSKDYLDAARAAGNDSVGEWNKVLRSFGLGMEVGYSKLNYFGEILDSALLTKPLW